MDPAAGEAHEDAEFGGGLEGGKGGEVSAGQLGGGDVCGRWGEEKGLRGLGLRASVEVC